jgi:hypothetical protein
MSKSHPRMKDISLVHALMSLRGILVDELARHADVQLENLTAWLSGTHTALANRSYLSILNYLGVTRSGLSAKNVQIWTIHAPKKFTFSQLESLKIMSGWLVGGQIIEITGSYSDFFNKVQVYAIRGRSFKILIHVKGGFRQPAEITPALITGVEYLQSFAGVPDVRLVDALYWHAIRTCAVTPAEFDDIFNGTYSQWSWHTLRLVARDRGITPSALADWVLQHDPKEQSVQTHINDAATTDYLGNIVSMAPTLTEAPVRSKSRKVEKVLEPVSVFAHLGSKN